MAAAAQLRELLKFLEEGLHQLEDQLASGVGDASAEVPLGRSLGILSFRQGAFWWSDEVTPHISIFDASMDVKFAVAPVLDVLIEQLCGHKLNLPALPDS